MHAQSSRNIKQDEDVGQAQKRRRLSSPPAEASEARSQSADDSMIWEADEDGCSTPPRDAQSPEPHFNSLAPSLDVKAAHELGSPSSYTHNPPASVCAEGQDATGQFALRSAHSSQTDADVDGQTTRMAARNNDSLDKLQHGNSARKVHARSAESEEALARYVAGDEAVREWSVVGGYKSEAVIASLQRFINAGEGSQVADVAVRISNFRAGHDRFVQKLTVIGRSTCTTAWKNSADLAVLAKRNNNPQAISKWLEIWHDDVYVAYRNACAAASGSNFSSAQLEAVYIPEGVTTRSKGKQVAPRSQRKPSATPSSSSSSWSPPPTEAASGQSSLSSLLRSPDSAVKNAPQADEQLAEIKRQLAQQARDIALLRQQTQQQSQQQPSQALPQETGQTESQDLPDTLQVRMLRRLGL